MVVQRIPFDLDMARAAAATGTDAAPAARKPPTPPPESGLAPLMQSKLTTSGEGGPRVWALVFRDGDEVMSGLTDFAKREGLEGGRLTGIGALSSAKLAFFDRTQLAYLDVPVDEQVECTSMNGDLGLVDGKPVFHVHCTVSYADGAVRGGHVLQAMVWPTMEIFFTESQVPLHKTHDAGSTLELYDFEG